MMNDDEKEIEKFSFSLQLHCPPLVLVERLLK